MTELTISRVFEAVAQRFPDRPSVIANDRAIAYSVLDENSDRLANFLIANGISLSRERDDLAPWESGQSHVGLLMYNSAVYLEAELAALKARAIGINVNYRYVADELIYLFRDAKIEALIFDDCFAEVVAEVLPHVATLKLLIQVPDSTGAALLPDAVRYQDALTHCKPGSPGATPSPDDLHILYTGGTTGKPKGVMWRQADLVVAALGGRRQDGTENSLQKFLALAERGASRTLPAGPFMHASGRWTALSQLLVGNTIVLADDTRRFRPDEIWRTIEKQRVDGLNIVGDAMAQPLLAELSNGIYDLSSLRAITSGAAVLSAAAKQEFMRRLPGVRIIDTIGSSETGPQASVTAAGTDNAEPAFEAATGTTILAADRTTRLSQQSSDVGWLARSGRIPLGYLDDAEKTSRAFVAVEGTRYAVPGDRACWASDGRIKLLGRDSSTINTGGEKVFAEEVEIALKHHAAVADAVVCGRPDPRWGQEIVAIVAMREGLPENTVALLEECAKHLARYKLPKAFIYVNAIARSASGKPDYDWARATAIDRREHVA